MNEASRRLTLGTIPALAVLLLAGCASTPQTRGEQQVLDAQAQSVVSQMVERDPSLRRVLNRSFGYVVIPRVSEAAWGIGGTGGVGVAYERGRPVGHVTLRQISTGIQAGAQRYAQLIVFQTPASFQSLRSGQFDLTAQATATVLGRGGAEQARFRNGVAVFVLPETGAMAGVSVAGQRLSFEPIV